MFMTALPASIGLRTGLAELNLGRSQMQDLPSDDLLRVVAELFDPEDFEDKKLAVEPALEAFNKLLKRSGLVAYLDAAGRCCLRNTGTGINSSILPQQPRPLSQEELAQRQKLAAYLDTASEDEFTERLLVPLFQRLGFHRVSPAGHKEKVLEFGKDLWMKYQLPTAAAEGRRRDLADARLNPVGWCAAGVLTAANSLYLFCTRTSDRPLDLFLCAGEAQQD